MSIAMEEWRIELKEGSDVDCQDSEGIWIPSCVQSVKVKKDSVDELKIHYKCWGTRWDEYIPRNSKRLAVYMSYKNVYRYPDGFQHNPNFSTSPYAHLSKDQRPIPRDQFHPITSPFSQRLQNSAQNYAGSKDIYRPRKQHAPVEPLIKAPYEYNKNEDDAYKRNLEDVRKRSKALCELENDKNLLLAVWESENLNEEKGLGPIPAVGRQSGSSSSSSAHVMSESVWCCLACSMWNDFGTTECKTCQTKKPQKKQEEEPKKKKAKDKLEAWRENYEKELDDEKQAMEIQEGERNYWACSSCTYHNNENDLRCTLCSEKKPLPFKGPEDYDPLEDGDEDIPFKSDIWFLRYAVKKDDSDKMEKFLKFVFVNDKMACERSLVWAAKFSAVNCIITLFHVYKPHINLQAAPLYYAVRNENAHVCNMILDEMESRVGEKYTVMSMCFKEIIKKDMVEIGERVLRKHFYRATEKDFELAKKIGGDFEEKLAARDPRNVVIGDDDDDFEMEWDEDGDDDNDDDDDGGMMVEEKHEFVEEKHNVGSMSDFETIEHPGDRVQSATEDEFVQPKPKPQQPSTFSDSEFSMIDTDVGMQSDASWVDL